MVARIVALVCALTISAQPAWASPYWRQIQHDLAAKAYANDRFLYASRPNINACQPGALTQKAKDRALTGMNRIRALHSLSPVRYSSLYDQSVQEAALIQAANGYPGHRPSTSARCYTVARAISGYKSDTFRDWDPVSNIITWVRSPGHRRWVLNPFATYVSYGHIYGYGVQKTFAFDQEPAGSPFVAVDYVAFPYRTYPAVLMKDGPPWSFSVVENKTNKHPYFQLATVTVTRMTDGAPLPTGQVSENMIGPGVPNFLSWQVKGWEYDTPYQVTIRNVAMQTRQLRTYSYPVTITQTGHQPAPPTRTVQREQQELTFPAPQQRVITREERERESRAAARAAQRLKQATQR